MPVFALSYVYRERIIANGRAPSSYAKLKLKRTDSTELR